MMLPIPGFADLQVNGFLGVDFSSAELSEKNFIEASQELIRRGTAVFLPTIITSSTAVFERNLRIISRAMHHETLRDHLPGIHVEGPFISPEDGARGAHMREWVVEPDIALLEKLMQWSDGALRMLTIAAEVKGAEELCRRAVSMGITVSLGHQLADESDLERMVDAGARSLTHLGNGLPNMLNRHHNPLLAGLGNDDLTAMIIADGHHVPPSLLKTIFRTKGLSKVVVTSDASPLAGLPSGEYHSFGHNVILEPCGRIHSKELGYLVGSSAIMAECINHLIELELIDEQEAIEVGFNQPLQLVGLDPEVFKKRLPACIGWNGKRFEAVPQSAS